MTEASVLIPSGLTGPLARAKSKTVAGTTVKEETLILDVPWRVDRSFRLSRWTGTTTATANWPWLFGLPSTVAAGNAIVINKLITMRSSQGLGTPNLTYDIARATAPAVGTVQTMSAIAVKRNTAMGASLAELRFGSTATKGAILRSFAYTAIAADDVSPVPLLDLRYKRQEWPMMVVLNPGEYIGGQFLVGISGVQPNGNERPYLTIDWDEVTL